MWNLLPDVLRTWNPKYWITNFSGYIQTVIRERWEKIHRVVQNTNNDVLFWSWGGFLSHIEKLLPAINYASVEQVEKDPKWTFQFLSGLYVQLQRSPWMSDSPDYLRFLGEYISSAHKSRNYTAWDEKLLEIESTINTHLRLLTGQNIDTLLANPGFETISINPEDIVLYRWTLLNTVANLAIYYFHIGQYELWVKYAQLGKMLGKILHSVQILYDLTVEELLATLNTESSNNATIIPLVVEAKEYYEMVMIVYRNNPDWEVFAKESEILFRTVELRLKTESIGLLWIPEIAELLREKEKLKQENATLTLEQRWLLIHVEILLYIAIDKLLATPIAVREELSDHLEDMVPILQSWRKINSNGLDLEQHLKWNNGWLFLGAFVDLFTYRVEKAMRRHPIDLIEKSQLLRIILTIYQKACEWWVGIDILGRKAYFKKLIRTSVSLLRHYYPGLSTLHEYTMIQTLWSLNSYEDTGTNSILSPVHDDMHVGISTWEELRLVQVLFGWIEAEKIHPGQRMNIANLTASNYQNKCMKDFLLIDFKWKTACSLTEWGDGSYTLRGGIAEGTFDRLPPFTAIAYIKIDPDGTLHTEQASCTIPAEQERMNMQFLEVLEQIQPDKSKIQYDLWEVLKDKIIYKDAFGSVYYDGMNSSWDHVYILQSKSSDTWCFRCELNTYINAKDECCIYAGSLINRNSGFPLGLILWWIAQFIQNSIWEEISTEEQARIHNLCSSIRVLFVRDSSETHGERTNEFSLRQYCRMFANQAPKSGNNTYDNTFVHTSFPGKLKKLRTT